MKACLAGLWAVLVVLVAVPVAAQPNPPSLSTVPKTIHRSSHGSVRQVVPDRPIPVPGSGIRTLDPGAAALAHIAGLEQMFGAAADLVVEGVSRRAGGSTVRLVQRIEGVPVYGAAVAVALRSDGSLLSATGALTERIVGGYSSGGELPSARRTAVARAAELSARGAETVRVRAASAAWFDPGLIDDRRPDAPAVPAYRYDLAAGGRLWRIFVAAGPGGAVLDAWPAEPALDRVVCDADSHGEEGKLGIPCGAAGSYPVVRAEGRRRVAGNEDANKVYDWMGDTENFYRRHTDLGSLTELIGIEVKDGGGKALRATVRVCVDACPYANAYWTDEQGFVIGGAVLGPDVVAHELTHGVTERISGLNYLNESGAINESMSDVFGEFTELTSTRGKRADRWKIGNGTVSGVIRDMKSPGSAPEPQPEVYEGPGWVPATHSDRHPAPDHGGVHTNSGVGNRLAYLITDGGTVGGRKVEGIGLDKAASLYWTVQTQLYPSADYPALANTLITVCHNNIDDKIAGFTEDDCARVEHAVEAVRIPLLRDRA